MPGTITPVAVGAKVTASTINQIIADIDDTGWISATPLLIGAGTLFYRRFMGRVNLRGSMSSAPGSAGTVFNLPAGFRPIANFSFVTYSSGTTTVTSARVNILATGDISLTSGLTPQFDGISFIADA